MEKIDENIPIRNEMKDLNREREILIEETLDGKNAFANNVKDILGEQIKAELAKKTVIIKETPKKKNKIQNFLDKLSKICQ